jgi:cytochrome c-type biogenesis protein CcmE
MVGQIHMSRIDDELASAIEGPDGPEVVKPAPASPAARKPCSARNVGILAALFIIAGLIGTLVFSSFNNAAVYAKTVDQLLASRDRLTGRPVRVQGLLVHGSLLRRDQPCEYRFKMAKNGAVLEVRYAQCVVPDTFRDRPETDVGVTAEGKLTREGVFEATQIMAKCPSKYEQRDGKRVPVGFVDPSQN